MGGPGSGKKKGSGVSGAILIRKQRKAPSTDSTAAYNKAQKAVDKAKRMKMGPDKNAAVAKAEAELKKVSKRKK